MKFIILESKLDKVIDRFIDKQIGYLKKLKVPLRENYFVWYEPKTGRIILDGVFSKTTREILISEATLAPLMMTFDLERDIAMECFHRWIFENWDIEDFDLFLDDTSYDPDLGNIQQYDEW